MEAHRLRAPSEDGGLLAEPPLKDAPERLAENRARLERWDHDFQGRRARRLRSMARSEMLAQARAYAAHVGIEPPPAALPERLVVTGHQPELFHPGVWIKNFAAAALARGADATALNLIVDDDIPKGASVRVPEPGGDGVRTRLVAFDDWAGELPYEDWIVRDESSFESFAARVRETLAGQISDPIIDDFWPRVLKTRQVTDRVGLRFAAARRDLEAAWGVHNLEVPLSALCETEAFLWFASHLLAELPRFQQIHNASLADYRQLYGIRSRHHPVPMLGQEGEWLEAPFWVWRAAAPRRRPLLIRQKAQTMDLRIAGEDSAFAEIPLAPHREACCAVDQLQSLPSQGIRLRTRALTTTMFARFLVGDLFIHGIGGAKYDELGDEITRRFFGIEPPAFLTVSMTLWLGLEDSPATETALHEVERALRDLRFNPDRHLDGRSQGPEVRRLIEAKHEALAGPTSNRRQRVNRFYEIQRCNEALQAAVQAEKERLDQLRASILAGLRLNRVARGRDYPFVLHSRHRFQKAISRTIPEGPGA